MNLTINTLTQHEFKRYAQQHPLSYGSYQTAAGTMQLAITDKGIYQASFTHEKTTPGVDQQSRDITKILLVGTDFQCKVWQAALRIPAGQTTSYQDLAQAIGHPTSWRAVANALANNKIAYFIPCHRIVRKNGGLGGYKWGLEKKVALLKSEGSLQ